MKKNIIFAIATGFFAVATVFNMNILQSNSAGDVSLEAITIMAQAQSGECPCDQEVPTSRLVLEAMRTAAEIMKNDKSVEVSVKVEYHDNGSVKRITFETTIKF